MSITSVGAFTSSTPMQRDLKKKPKKKKPTKKKKPYKKIVRA